MITSTSRFWRRYFWSIIYPDIYDRRFGPRRFHSYQSWNIQNQSMCSLFTIRSMLLIPNSDTFSMVCDSVTNYYALKIISNNFVCIYLVCRLRLFYWYWKFYCVLIDYCLICDKCCWILVDRKSYQWEVPQKGCKTCLLSVSIIPQPHTILRTPNIDIHAVDYSDHF